MYKSQTRNLYKVEDQLHQLISPFPHYSYHVLGMSGFVFLLPTAVPRRYHHCSSDTDGDRGSAWPELHKLMYLSRAQVSPLAKPRAYLSCTLSFCEVAP